MASVAYAISASRAQRASPRLVIPMTSKPALWFAMDSARVLKAGPSIFRSHGERGVCDFGFTSETCCAQIGHPNDIKARVVVCDGFGAGAEGGTLHIQISWRAWRMRFRFHERNVLRPDWSSQ